jgi:tyrosyl-DNA phosphodiesterase-1
MLTSANMSKQAWGEAKRATGDIRIASWEAGVLVWPKLIEEGSILVPCFKSDTPDKNCWDGEQRILAGLRIPYDMPLQRYGSDETPWVATMAYNEPDRLGQTWVA